MNIRLMSIAAAVVACALAAPGAATATTASTGIVHLDGARTTLTTDPATTGVLVKHGILPLPVGPATVQTRFGADGLSLRYSFPITSGRLDGATLAGVINHSGGLRFVNIANGHTLTLTNFRIHISDRPGLTAEVNGDPSVRVRILNLDLGDATIGGGPQLVTVSNVHATLTRTAASALNATLDVSFFSRGIPLGTADVTATIA